MPDLGTYAGEVAAAYALSILLVGALVIQSVLRGRSVRRALRAVEERVARARNGTGAHDA
jgi:heme exporter protein D